MCVPLLGASRLSPGSLSKTSGHLNDLIQVLSKIPSEQLNSNLISYVFLPVSTVLQRNSSSEIPDGILEKIFTVLMFLAESWWWTCDVKVWEQIFMLSGSVIGGIENKGGEGKSRDDETKAAAMLTLKTILRPRAPEEAFKRSLPTMEAEERLSELQGLTKDSKFIPIIGQTLDATLNTTSSQHIPLQRASLDVLSILVNIYLPDSLIPSVLPGIVSTMTKISLGVPQGKGWANGDVVARALLVMQDTIVKAIGDDICIQHGALRRVRNLDDLINMNDLPTPPAEERSRFGTPRTESWLRGTSTQLHIAINSLNPLLAHPTPSALRALATFSATVIGATPLALPQTTPLLLSFLLSISLSDYASVSVEARRLLLDLLSHSSDAQIPLQQILMTNLGNNLSALPRLLSTQADAKVTHAAGLIEAACRIATTDQAHQGLDFVSKGIGKLLGPTGGIEKWGWGLLSVLEILEPPIVVTHTSSAQLALESNPETPYSISFPELVFKNISSHETRDALKRMFHALGSAGGDSSLFAVEWFVRTGCSGETSVSVAALWCACRLLEGSAHISLYDEHLSTSLSHPSTKRLEKHAKGYARMIAEIWDQIDPNPSLEAEARESADEEHPLLVQHQKGVTPLHETLKIVHPSRPSPRSRQLQPVVHRALCLQLLAVSAGISQSRFSSLFIHTLYPVLHSLVSPFSFLSSTALATLNFITVATSFASPANLLLSNFDYVLDSVSRRLTQRWLDIDATKVLGIMIRLVGTDIVEKAGDVVEECFDRLDEFHGYSVVVDGLIDVLTQVLKVIELEAKANPSSSAPNKATLELRSRKKKLDGFFAYLPARFDNLDHEDDKTDYGPAPKEPWGKAKVYAESDNEKVDEVDEQPNDPPAFDEPPPTIIQALTKQIVARSMYFLTHESPVIRARILSLLTLAVPVLPESSLLPSIHSAWPFILNRLQDVETFVVTAAAGLIEALAEHVGEFMFRRIWDDVWPKFRTMLRQLELGERTSALSRREKGGSGAQSAYTHSHRLYRSLLKTMTAALADVHQHEPSFWEVTVAFRRFLASTAQEELQQCAVQLYTRAGRQNPDAVWLLLTSTKSGVGPILNFMSELQWDVDQNVDIVMKGLE